MRTQSLFILAAASALVLASCSKAASDIPAITIEAGIGSLTKVSYDGDTATFQSGDKLSVYAWTGSASAVSSSLAVNGIVNTFDGSKWTPESPMLWEDKSSAHYFLGISPAREVTNFTADSYTLDPTKFTASDLLIAKNVDGLTPSSTPVSLSFTHALARLDVNLTFRNQWDATPTVTSVAATAKKSATVDYLAKEFTVNGSASAVSLTKGTDAKWSGLQIPQDGVKTITVTIDGKDYVFTHTTDIPLKGGKYTTVNLTVGRDRIELAGSGITISDWTAGDTIDGGEAQDD